MPRHRRFNPTVHFICLECRKPFTRKASQTFKPSAGRFCSMPCVYESRRAPPKPTETRQCEHCHGPFECPPQSPMRFCTRLCSVRRVGAARRGLSAPAYRKQAIAGRSETAKALPSRHSGEAAASTATGAKKAPPARRQRVEWADFTH
jgi:hypothetical protein